MKTITPDPGDGFCNLSTDQLLVEVVRGLDRIAEGPTMVDEGASYAGLALSRIAVLTPGAQREREAYVNQVSGTDQRQIYVTPSIRCATSRHRRRRHRPGP